MQCDVKSGGNFATVMNKKENEVSLMMPSKKLKKFDNLDPTTYPSDPAQRGTLMEIGKLEKDLEPTKKRPSTWDVIYQSMTPIEKGQWNREQRAKGMNGKTGDPLPKEETKEILDLDLNNHLEDIRQIRRDAEDLRTLRQRQLPERKIAIRKPEPAGLHETFTQDKLTEGSILKQIREDNEKV